MILVYYENEGLMSRSLPFFLREHYSDAATRQLVERITATDPEYRADDAFDAFAVATNDPRDVLILSVQGR